MPERKQPPAPPELQPGREPQHAWQGAQHIGPVVGGTDLPTNRDGYSEPMRKGIELLQNPTSILGEFLDHLLPSAGSGLFTKGNK